jgi:hypothetical protein
MSVACGQITAPAVGLPTSVVVSPGFVPKLVYLFTSLQQSFNTFDGELYHCQMLACNDGTPTLVNDDLKGRWDGFWSASSVVRGSTSVIGGGANFSSTTHMSWTVSFSGSSFSVDFGNVIDPAAWKIGYVVWGGTEVSASLQIVNSPTSTGAQAIAHGLGVAPTYVMTVGGRTGGSSGGVVSIGHTDGTRQGASSWQVNSTVPTAGATICKSYQVTNKCVAIQHRETGAVLVEAGLTSLDATNINLNWTTVTGTNQAFVVAALSGVPTHVGAVTQPASTSDHTTTGITIQPQVVLLQSVGKAASAAVVADGRFTLGVSDATTQFAIGNLDTDGSTTTKTRRCSETVANFTSTPSTVSASATVDDLGALDTEGFMTLGWTVVDATLRQHLYASWGAELGTTPDTGEDPDYEVTIGEETGLNPLRETFRIQETLDAPDVAIMDFESQGSPYTRFSLGQSVFVTENDVRIFGGYVTGVRERGFSGPNGDDLVVEIQATSYEINAQRRVITDTFSGGSPAMTLKEALEDLITDYYGDVGVTLHPSQTDGPTLPTLSFERQRGDVVNREIVESVGYLYSIDFANRLRAWAPGDISAPDDYDEDVNPELLTGDIEVEKQLQNGYANKIILVGEGIVITDHLDSFVGDGVEDTFDLTYKIVGPVPYGDGTGAVGYAVVNYNGVPGSEPIGGLLATGLDWKYDPIARTIQRTAGVPGNGVPFTIQYHGLFEPSATAEDAGEIATYGLWEHVEHVTTVTDDTSAQAYADALLAQKLASKSEIATLYTRSLGFHPGQTIGIESPLRELTGSFLITQVDSGFLDAGVRLTRKITAAKSENNDHDWRKVIQQWSQGGTTATSTESGTSTTTSSGAGLGLHATHHQSGGIDPIKLDDLATPDDNADLNASTTRHGLLRKLNNDSDYFLDGTGNWAIPPSSGSPGSPSGNGGLVLLEQHTASSSASLDFTTAISSLYDEYLVEGLNLVPATNGVGPKLRVSTDGGSSYDSGSNYQWSTFRYVNVASAVGGSTSDTSIDLALNDGGSVSNTASNGGVSFTFRLINPLSGSMFTKVIAGNGNIINVVNGMFGGDYKSTTAVDAFQVFMSSGNITSGTVRVYGLEK